MKRSMKIALAAVLALVFALSVPFTSMAAPAVNVTVLDEPVVWTDAEPFIDDNDRTLVPLRAVGEALGLTVDWDEEARTAIFSDQYTAEDGYTETMMITFPIGSQEAKAYYHVVYPDGFVEQWGDVVYMDTAAVIVNNRTYAPVRYLAEFFGYEVTWNPDTRTVGVGFPASALDFNFCEWYADFTASDEMLLMGVPGEDYELVKDIEITGVKVNGKSVDFYETNKFELIPEGVDLEDCYGVCFNAYFDDFENAKIEADIVVNTIDSRKFMFSIGLSGFFDPTLHK